MEPRKQWSPKSLGFSAVRINGRILRTLLQMPSEHNTYLFHAKYFVKSSSSSALYPKYPPKRQINHILSSCLSMSFSVFLSRLRFPHLTCLLPVSDKATAFNRFRKMHISYLPLASKRTLLTWQWTDCIWKRILNKKGLMCTFSLEKHLKFP